jgi:hypothetical protein
MKLKLFTQPFQDVEEINNQSLRAFCHQQEVVTGGCKMKLDYDDLDTYGLLLDVTVPYGIDPSIPYESELFFRNLLAEYQGDLEIESLRAWLSDKVAQSFVAFGERPRWIHSASLC